jgi:hypothetical protein
MFGRWLLGLFRYLLRQWDEKEWTYYARTGLDPNLPAFKRWELQLKTTELAPENATEEKLPRKNYSVILHDKYGLSLDDVVYFTPDLGRAEALEKRLNDELQSRDSGWFWHDQIAHRNLDFIHNLRLGEQIVEGSAGDEDDLEATKREFFRQQ